MANAADIEPHAKHDTVAVAIVSPGDLAERRPADLGSVRKLVLNEDPHVSLDKRQTDHATKVFGGLLVPRENATEFFEPPDGTFDNVSSAVEFAVKLHRPCVAVFVSLRRNHRGDAQVQQVLVKSIHSARYLLSSPTATGQATGLPSPLHRWLAVIITESTTVDS